MSSLPTLADIYRARAAIGPWVRRTPLVRSDALSRRLLEAHARGRRTVIIIDEAQNLSMEALEEVRLLTNLETTREKLLQVILIGQPELVEMMQRPELRQLAQRVTARYHLKPFGFAGTKAYVQHRLEVAGQREALFTPTALWIVHRRSDGIPRLINNICDRALLGAFAKGRPRVTALIARRAAAEVLGPGLGQYVLETGVAAAVVAAVLFGATLLRPDALDYAKTWWAKRIMSHAVALAPGEASGVTVPAAVAAPTLALPKPSGEPLDALLSSRSQDQHAAFSSLFAA